MNINNLNMRYVFSTENEQFENGAVLHCSKSWTIAELVKWLPDFDLDMLESVKEWLGNDHVIAEGGSAKIWCDGGDNE